MALPSEYSASTAVTVTLSVPTPDGTNPLSASGVEYAVFDEEGEVVVTRRAYVGYSGGDTEIAIEIASSDNALASGVIRGARRVEAYFTTDDGVYTAVGRYILSVPNELIARQNSFCTYEQALVEDFSMSDLSGWDAASEDERIGAMIAAYLRLCRMNYRYPVSSASQSVLTGIFDPYETDGHGKIWGYVTDIYNATDTQWAQFSTDFKRALRRAQLVEADAILAGDPVVDMRASGIISETVGESKVFLRQIPEVRTAVSKRALQELRGFTYRSNRIGRS